MHGGLFAAGLIMLLLGAFVASVEDSNLPMPFLCIGVILMIGSRFIRS